MKKIVCYLLCIVLVIPMVLFAGCSGGRGKNGEINVFNWGDYISNGEGGSIDSIREFEKETGIKVNYTNYETNEEMYNIINNVNSSYDVIIPSDYMIDKLIKQDMLAEINFNNIPNYRNLMDRFKTTTYDREGKYSVAYSWGVVALCYNKAMVDIKPSSFASLWDKKYSGQILMFNNSRDAMAIAMQLKNIDHDNITMKDVDVAADYLKEQKPLLKRYVMDQVFTEMEGSHAALAPYYAGDISVMIENNEDLDYVFPMEGSNLFVDAMCIPKNSKNKDLAEKFINFMLKPEIAKANANYTGYSTPNQAAYDIMDYNIKNNELLYPGEDYLNKCYSFTSLPQDVYDYMQDKFLKVQA